MYHATWGKAVVIGGGFVGLNVAILLAKKRFNVTIIDVNDAIIEKINSKEVKKLHVKEKYVHENWEHVKPRIQAGKDYSVIKDVKTIFIAVQTPFNGSEIDFSPLKKVVNEIAKYLQSGTLISSEVTLYPGGTQEYIANPLAELTGLKLDEELLIVHVPERLNPGSSEWTIEDIPRVIGGIGPNSLKAGVALYRDILGLNVYEVYDIRIAEASKLLENAFRFINIAFINELKRFFDNQNLNIKDVIAAASTKPFGYMPFNPGPYIGGPCIPKDFFMLSKYIDSSLLKRFWEINEEQPKYYAEKIYALIKEKGGKKVLFYGIGSKPESSYDANSPIYKLINDLKHIDNRIEIKKYDPKIIHNSDFQSEDEAIEWADIIFTWGYNINFPHYKIEEL
ncbi:MAG: nucleotide sugar dehydrogenase [Candidatus Nezhaarchaeales archaeon]